MYVADNEFNNMQIFTPEGQILMAVGNFGPGPGSSSCSPAWLLISKIAWWRADGGPVPRIEVFRYVTDAEAKAAEEKMSKAGGGRQQRRG